MDFEVEILKYPTEEDWMLCKICTLVTVGKNAIKPPDNEWKAKILKEKALSKECEFKRVDYNNLSVKSLALDGSLFDFEYLKLFRLGALATAIGIFASFVITTAFVLKDGGSPFGMSLADIASAASVLVNVALCTALFFLAKRTK